MRRERRRSVKAAFAAVLVSSVLSQSAAIAAEPSRSPGTPHQKHRTGSYIVVLNDSVDDELHSSGTVAGNLSATYGGTTTRVYDHALRGFSIRATPNQVQRLSRDPAVAYIERDSIVRPAEEQQTNPTWGVDRLDQRARLPKGDYFYTSDGSGIEAYVVDSGLRTTHVDFEGRARHGWDFVDNDPTAEDCFGHGTHVAGTIGGHRYGVAKGVELIGVRVFDCNESGRNSDVIAALDWITANAELPAVVNLSLGGSPSNSLDSAVRNTIDDGLFVAIAAGNNDDDACDRSPARVSEGMTVGATMTNDARWTGSNWGPCVDIFAPGYSTLSSHYLDDFSNLHRTGTSMAAPHVTGAGARFLQENPSASPAVVKNALERNSTATVNNIGVGSPNRLLHLNIGHQPTGNCPITRFNHYNRSIPDIGTAYSTVSVTECATGSQYVGPIEVTVDIEHPRTDQLKISLITPDGENVLVKPIGEPADGQTKYTVTVEATDRNGQWKLKVRDLYTDLSGYIDAWGLRF